MVETTKTGLTGSLLPGNQNRETGYMGRHAATMKAGVSRICTFAANLLPASLLNLVVFLPARAQEASSNNGGWISLMSSTDVLMLAVFGGSMSFALLSATWLIRERGRISVENQKLRENLSRIRAQNDRNEALLNVPEQRIVVWNGSDERPVVLGSLNKLSGCPERKGQFLSFGSWLGSDSNSMFEPALRELRMNAKPFDMVLTTKTGGILEVQGRTSGSHAHVRFRELGSEREEHARLKFDHSLLQERLSNIESLFDKLPMPVWFRDAEGRLSWVNRCFADAVECQTPEATIQSNRDIFDHERTREILKHQEDQPVYHNKLPATIAGDRRKLEVFSIRGNGGFAGIAFDRSEIDSLERSLKDAKEGHSRMLDQIDTAVAIFDKSQKLMFCNAGFQKLWNIDPAFLESSPSNAEVLDAMRDKKLLPEHPDWRSWRESKLDIYKAIEPMDEWWHLLNGQTIHVTAIPRAEGGVNWIFQNVTEQLALESNNKSLMRMQGETLDHLNEAVAVFGSDGKLRLFNPSLEDLWVHAGIEVNEGLHIAKIISAWTDSVSNANDLENILGKITGFDDQRSNLEGRLELQSGSTLEYSLVPLPEGQSMLTLTDVTASVNFERALRERAEALEASDLLKTRFIQHVSYELRAPLTSIVGFGEVLASSDFGTMNERQSEYLSYINASANELSTIVGDILDLASVDAGTMRVEFKEVNLASIVSSAIGNHERTIADRGLKPKVSIDPSSVDMVADEHRLSQIIDNLVSNAVNFSPDGGTISIEAGQEDEHHVIKVTDQGPGVDDDQKDEIFGRFEARTTHGQRRGTGLGLSIVRSFVELHGGEVVVTDGPDRGASFVCRIPVSPDSSEKPSDDGQQSRSAVY